MKKNYILTLFLFLFISSFSFGQEMLVNGNFESWDDATTPTGWDLAQNITQETTVVHGGSNSALRNGGSSTNKLNQNITGIVGGDSYTISVWFKADGDGSDVRIWGFWRTGTTNLDDNAAELRGPNNSYLDNNGNVWTQYSVTLDAPEAADAFFFEVRSYSQSTVYWDDFSFAHNTSYDLLEDFETALPAGALVGDAGMATTPEVVADPATGGTNGNVLKIVTSAAGFVYQNAQLFFQGDHLDLTTEDKVVTVDVYSEVATSILAKVATPSNGGAESATDASHGGTGWETLTFDFSDPKDGTPVANDVFGRFLFFPLWTGTGFPSSSSVTTTFVDNIKGIGSEVVTNPDPEPSTAPTTPPAREAGDVISIYGESYGTALGLSGVDWDSGSVSSESTYASNNALKIVNGSADFIGFNVNGGGVDASAMTNVHADFWVAGTYVVGQVVKIKLSNHDSSAEINAIIKEVVPSADNAQSWISIDAELGTEARDNIKQILIIYTNSAGAADIVYADNIYMYKEASTSQTITVSIDVSADPGGVNIVTPTVSGNWAEYAATVDPNNANKYSYTFAEGVTSAEFVWKVYGTSAGDVQESLTSLVGGGAIENNLAATLPTGNGINTDYSTYCNRTVASDSGDFVAPTFVFNSFRQVGVTYTELVLTADSGDSYAIDYSVNDYSEYHGPGATDNGDGTYTVIVDPSSAFTYLWYNITTSTQEDLSACDSSNRDHAAGDSEADSFGVCPTTATGNSVTVATSQAWNGYVAAFNVSDDAYAGFGFSYPAADLRATATTTSMTLEPNTAIWTAEAGNAAWFDQDATEQTAVLYIEANSYIEDNSLAGEALTFSGNVSVSDLGSGYTPVAFIKALDPNSGFATVLNNTVSISSTGDFTVSATAAELAAGYTIQYGFSVKGPLADPTDTSLGSIVIGAETLRVEDVNVINVSVYPNPSSFDWNFRAPNTVIKSVEIFNLLGKRVVSQRNNSTDVAISTQGLTNGIYIARITTEQGTKSVKLIKN